ncbi:MAG: hypothetical protein U0M70_03695 [Eubacteriales bacterium]
MPRKPKYINPDQTIEDFYASVSDSYHHPAAGEETGNPARKKQELLAEEFGISRIKVRKILITTGDLKYPETRQIQELLAASNQMTEVCDILKMAPSTVNSLLPYSKGVYGLDVSAAADRTELYRARKTAVEELKNAVECGDWSLDLWKAICLFSNYPFQTSGRGGKGGIKFRYTVSTPGGSGGRHYDGESIEGYGNEMWIGGKEKSISRSTVDLAFTRALELGGVVNGPRTLNVPGAHSYLYPIFVRFGVIGS